jgi:hypothetical protein
MVRWCVVGRVPHAQLAAQAAGNANPWSLMAPTSTRKGSARRGRRRPRGRERAAKRGGAGAITRVSNQSRLDARATRLADGARGSACNTIELPKVLEASPGCRRAFERCGWADVVAATHLLGVRAGHRSVADAQAPPRRPLPHVGRGALGPIVREGLVAGVHLREERGANGRAVNAPRRGTTTTCGGARSPRPPHRPETS